MVNGHYRPSYMGDLGACGCQAVPATGETGGFDLSGIPIWVWIAAGVGAFMLFSRKSR